MAKPNYLYLCRHGQSQFNAQGRLQGQMDNPLTALGKEQALGLARRAKEWNIRHVISSPLTRAQQTAQLCAQTLGLPLQVRKGLEERDFGSWQGKAIAELDEYSPFRKQCYLHTDLAPKGGESTAAVRFRFLNQLQLIANQAVGNTLLVSHGDAINCLLSIWQQPLHIDNCQAIRLIQTDAGFALDTQ